MSLLFHPLVRRWFDERFESPTDAQKAGWPAIAEGRHTLIAAPTGSGKTLAAFMTCIDGLVRAGLDGGLPERTEVVYVSPLKALSNDIRRNLAEPLSEITALAEAEGTPLEEIRVAVRTGDTPARERQAMAKRPPHILITTPESLYILLTSKSGREALRGARTLILDELHAVAGNKRGSHLSLSVERLCELADDPVTRIGLSATQRPVDEVARFLVGCDNIDADGDAQCTIVDTGHRRAMDLQLRLPEDELGPIATHEMWGQTLDDVAELVKAHETTLVFVNTRRLVERVTRQMSDRLGEEAVVPHHGSLSKERRHDAEQRLKSGQVSLCVATSSLELGIDIGSVDLVCQIGSPRSIGLMLQRVGRSGHQVGRHPEGPPVPAHPRRADRVHGDDSRLQARQPGPACHSRLAARRAGAADRRRVRRPRVGRGTRSTNWCAGRTRTATCRWTGTSRCWRRSPAASPRARAGGRPTCTATP